MMLKEQCQLQKGLNSKDLDVLELLRGVSSDKICKEILKKKKAKANELVKIAK